MECISKFDVSAGITLAIFWLYFMFYVGKFGILPSISASGPALKRIKRNYQWFFYVWLLAMAAPLVVFLEISGWYFLMIVAMGVLGTTPNYDESKEIAWKHNIASYLSMGVPIVILSVTGQWYIAVSFIVTFLLMKFVFKISNLTTWVEVAAVNIGCIGLMIAY